MLYPPNGPHQPRRRNAGHGTRSAGYPVAHRCSAPSPLANNASSASLALVHFEEFQTGARFGSGYVRGPAIACGANGDVYKALASWPDGRQTEVAVKHMRVSSPSVQRQALREISAVFTARKHHMEEVGDLRSQGHPNIVAYLDWFADGGGLDRELFLVMECCDFSLADMTCTVGSMRTEFEKQLVPSGGDRCPSSRPSSATNCVDGHHQHQRAGPPQCVDESALFRFPESEVLKIMMHMLEALVFLNRHAIIHRDIKTENIMWTSAADASGLYKLADFGCASCSGDESRMHKNCGTLWTMSPEMLGRRPHSLNCDVWSLGCVLFEVAILERPFQSKELLAYRNSHESELEGTFWATVLENVFPATSVAKHSKKVITAQTVGRRGSAASQIGKSCPERSVSLSSLPSVQGRQSSTAQSRGLERAARPTAVTVLPRVPSCGSLDSPPASSPSSPTASPTSLRGSKRRLFLRKRCGTRWIYSSELRGIIFDGMLEEDVLRRPTAADVLKTPGLQDLVSRPSSFDANDHILSERTVYSIAPPGAIAGPTVVRLLQRVTGHAFLEANRAEISAKSSIGRR